MEGRSSIGIKGIIVAGAACIAIACGIYSCTKDSRYKKAEIAAVAAGQKPGFEERLNKASEIFIEEANFSWGKHYDIYVNEDEVAEVTGKNIKLWSDEFTLKTLDGKVLATEKENKRIFRWNREAVFYDSKGKINGYIGEERWNDLFKWGYIFHFFDENKNEIGLSQKIGRTAISFHQLYDNKGKVLYDIDKRFNLIRDAYTLSVKDKDSIIPLDHAILLVCIEDAIKDSEVDKESKSSDSNSK